MSDIVIKITINYNLDIAFWMDLPVGYNLAHNMSDQTEFLNLMLTSA